MRIDERTEQGINQTFACFGVTLFTVKQLFMLLQRAVHIIFIVGFRVLGSTSKTSDKFECKRIIRIQQQTSSRIMLKRRKHFES
jgi:hypothetical protein